MKGRRSRLFHNGFNRFYGTQEFNFAKSPLECFKRVFSSREITGSALKSANSLSKVHIYLILLCYCNEHERVGC